MKIISKTEAKSRGLKRYFTGKPCKRGHVSERYMSGACITCSIEASTQWQKENRKQRKDTSHQWYKENTQRKIDSNRRWRKANPKHVQAHRRNRRAKLRNSDGSHTGNDIKRLEEKQRMQCVYCHTILDDGYHVDHIIPLSKGGDNTKYNLQLLCPSCNLRKHNKNPIEFAQDRGLLL